MPISYCCHLISSVELRYSADRPLPSYILKSFKHPRIYDSDNYFANKSSSSSDCADTKVTQRDEITKCNLILESHGYSLIRQNDPEGTVKIKKVGTRGRVGKKRSLELSDKATSQNVMIWRKDDDAIYRIMDMIRKAMIYHVCFYDDTVYENEVLLSRISKVTKESSKVSKNSTYEMLYALHDCLVQLRKKTGDGMEAILITEEYSGLFTKDEILITRSSMAFRSALIDEGIHYNTIYHTTGPNNYTGHMDLNPDDIVCSYLKIPLTSQSQESVRNLDDSLAIVEFQEIGKHDEPSKEAFFRALNLPLSDDYDVNVIFVRGRHHCQKMLRFLAKQAEDVLLNMKKTTLRVAPVKLVLSNFPVLFSKLYELRVTWADLIDQNSSERYAITIKGLVLPTVLSSLFKIARRLQTQGMINEASLLITYNTDLDSELHEDSLQISENNRIYNNFMVNMSSLEKMHPQMYSLLKKMVPYAVFMVRKGRVSVPAHGAMRKQGSICLSHSFGHGDLSSRSVSLYDSNRIQSLYGISNIEYNPDGNGTIVVLRDTLYTNLSKIKSIIQHIEGTSVIKTMPTKVIISEAISRIASVGIADARSYDHNLKCYVDLYPSMEDGNNAIWTYVQPYNLMNIVCLVGYLLHAGAYLLFFDPCFTTDGNLDSSLDKRLNCSGTADVINAEDSVSIFDQRLSADKYTLDMNSLVNDPLAQQSYIIKLIIRVSFNKRFQTVFGLPYKDHLHNTMKLTRNFQDREANSAKRKRSLPSDIHESTPLYLASNWDALIHRSKSLALSISDNYDDDITEALTNIENLTPESDVVSPRPMDALDITTNSRPTGFTNIVASITSGDIAKISREVSESLTKVSSTTRAHGRLHHCVFHFDTKEPLKGENGISSLEKEIENISNADITPEIKPGNKIHLVFVFLTPKNITPLVSSRIKLLKDVINSSDIVFVHDKSSKENPPMEYNMINAKNFIDTLKVEYVPAKHGNYNEKCGVPYSFVADVELTTYIYYVCMDIDVSLGQGNCINENKRTLISNTRSKHPGKDIREYFLSYSWICDVYSSGFIDLDADIPKMHLLPFDDGQLKDHYYFSTPMTEHKSAHRGVFPFSIGYQHVKFLWGWNIYVLTLRNEVVSEKDCFLYRKHCGLRVASYNTLDSIANDIKNKLRAELKVHGINEEDVSTYFTHSRIYMNTLIVMGDSMWHPSDFDVACRNANYQDACLNITFGGKLICFGRYQGIPLLMSTWFTDTMCQSRPAAIHEYTIEHQSSP
uniref:Uncharacterized protein n=1 Tax=Babesia bovis TaxID=5865 RepID=A7AVC8_BABBO|eukprot:XP_001609322.1 hypothetical protein [Babesia bovis T2Bo]